MAERQTLKGKRTTKFRNTGLIKLSYSLAMGKANVKRNEVCLQVLTERPTRYCMGNSDKKAKYGKGNIMWSL